MAGIFSIASPSGAGDSHKTTVGYCRILAHCENLICRIGLLSICLTLAFDSGWLKAFAFMLAIFFQLPSGNYVFGITALLDSGAVQKPRHLRPDELVYKRLLETN